MPPILALLTRLQLQVRNLFMGRPQGEFVSGVLLTFSGLALLLASFGLFSVVSYAIVHRTREFAIRLALGASRSTVLRAALQSTTVAVGLDSPSVWC